MVKLNQLDSSVKDYDNFLRKQKKIQDLVQSINTYELSHLDVNELSKKLEERRGVLLELNYAISTSINYNELQKRWINYLSI